MQRLQRYATYGHLKQLVLRLIADDVVALSEEMSDKVLALRWLFAPVVLGSAVLLDPREVSMKVFESEIGKCQMPK